MYLRHRHWEALNDHIVVEGLEDISRYQGMVNPGVFVGVETLQVFLAYVNHFGSCTLH